MFNRNGNSTSQLKQYFLWLSMLLLLVLLPVQRAEAGSFMLEPHAAYQYDTFKIDFPASFGTLNETVTGPSIGLGLGYAFLMFYAEVDYDYGMLNSSVSSQPASASYSGGTVIRNTLSLQAGLHIPMIRAYVGYAPLDNWTFKNGTIITSSDATFLGSAVKVGASFTGLPLIAINLEYQVSTFSSYTDTANHSFPSGVLQDANASTILLSVSLPFEF